MSLLSKLTNKAKLLLGATLLATSALSAGCSGSQTEWELQRTQIEHISSRESKERGESNFSYKIKPAIKSENIQTEENSTLNIEITGEKRETETQIIKRINIITERPVYTHVRKTSHSPLATFLLPASLTPGKVETMQTQGEITIRKEPLSEERIPLPETLKEIITLPNIELSIKSNKDVFFDGKNPLTLKSDENGKAFAKISSNTYTRSLEELINKTPIFKELTPASNSIREAILKDGIVEVSVPYIVSVNKGIYNGILISDNFVIGDIKFRDISSEYLSKKTSEFVKANVNPTLKTLVLSARDIDSHIQLRRASYTLKTKAPSREDLLKPYFSGSMLEMAKGHLEHYEIGDRTIENGEGTVTLKFAPGSEVEIEVTNPKYNFYQGKFTVNEDGKKMIELSELGNKTRVRIVDE